MSKQWFILNTFTGQESKVAEALKKFQKNVEQNFLGEILIPTVLETTEENGKKIECRRKRYPGYAFAEIDLYEDFAKSKVKKDLFEKINALPGMIGFLGGNEPRPLNEDEILSLRKDMEEGKKLKKQIELNVGDEVKILDGAFANNIGTISKKNDSEQIANVEFQMFGEDMTTEVPYGSLEKIEENDG